VRILVTNDDGIDSIGLHLLARALVRHGDVMIVAPDSEYSGSGAAFGAIYEIRPEVRETAVEGVPTAYTVDGPPGLCVFVARLGAFGPPPDLVVAGINPGANVGRSVYHSGTVGAALTARNGEIHGIAVSQEVRNMAVEGQGWEGVLAQQKWETAVTVADAVVEGFLAAPPAQASVLNVNVPNLALDELRGWRYAEIGTVPPRAMATARLEPKPGHTGVHHVRFASGEPVELPEHIDGGAVERGYVALSWVGRLTHDTAPAPKVDAAISALLGPPA
jgi:5'-nucleotidase